MSRDVVERLAHGPADSHRPSSPPRSSAQGGRGGGHAHARNVRVAVLADEARGAHRRRSQDVSATGSPETRDASARRPTWDGLARGVRRTEATARARDITTARPDAEGGRSRAGAGPDARLEVGRAGRSAPPYRRGALLETDEPIRRRPAALHTGGGLRYDLPSAGREVLTTAIENGARAGARR